MSIPIRRIKEFHSGEVMEGIYEAFGLPLANPAIPVGRVELEWVKGEISILAYNLEKAMKLTVNDGSVDVYDQGKYTFAEMAPSDTRHIVTTICDGKRPYRTEQAWSSQRGLTGKPRLIHTTDADAAKAYKRITEIVALVMPLISPYTTPAVIAPAAPSKIPTVLKASYKDVDAYDPNAVRPVNLDTLRKLGPSH